MQNIEDYTSEIQHPISEINSFYNPSYSTNAELGIYEGFPTIADLGFLISEVKKILFIFYKIQKLTLPKSNIRYPK
ncbi:hypothetical protein [Cellulophaga sp. BC115SP]|uniref:hypothetical protein n=1 Tax=Cellulophaga sp. BC115SP TaxID=2683263 RepID=UPI001412885C|nr:hypothetical protein [Cellulophaga sp. BC115SP]